MYGGDHASVGWHMNVTTTTASELWSAPLVTNVTFLEAGDKQFWAPWDRGDALNPLLPSDGDTRTKDERIASTLKGNARRMKSGVWDGPLLEHPVSLTEMRMPAYAQGVRRESGESSDR